MKTDFVDGKISGITACIAICEKNPFMSSGAAANVMRNMLDQLETLNSKNYLK